MIQTQIQTQFNKSNKSNNTLKSKTIQVDGKFVGAIIGQRGTTVKALASAAGKGCRIRHQRENNGCFVITAYDTSTILRAELQIQSHIKTLLHKAPIKHFTQTRNTYTTGSRFESLRDDDHKEDKTTFSGKNNSLTPGFKINGTIRDRKTKHWLSRYATNEEKQSYHYRNTQSKRVSVVTPPSLLHGSDYKAPIITGAWASLSNVVMSERPKTPPPPTPTNLLTLKEGDIRADPKEMNFTAIKRIEFMELPEVTHQEDDAFSEMSEVPSEDEETWEDWSNDLVGDWGDEE